MYKKCKNIFSILILLTFLFAFMHFISASDSQLYQSCGGDSQTIIGCIGDSQLSFMSGQAVPTLTLIKPTNGTYFTNISIPLQFIVSGETNIFYNLDSGSNVTINSNTTFNTTQGPHTLYLYANNSGLVSKNVTFTVNNSKFVIYYNKYASFSKGSSTDFNTSTYEDLQSFSGVTLQNTNYGQIYFGGVVNFTNIPNNTLDLDSNTNISLNYIFINSTALPNLNIPATLYFYNLTFANTPQILKDGSPCPSSICTLINYSVGTLIFNVTGFSAYSSREAPSSNQTIMVGNVIVSGGGGYPVPTTAALPLSFNPTSLKAFLKQGEITTQNVTITNTGTQILTLSISTTLGDLARLSDTSITLNPGESKSISVDFIARDNTNPDLYLGAIVFSSGGVSSQIFVALEIESKAPLLDVEINLPDKEVSLGQNLLAEMQLYNLGVTGRVDVYLEYQIKDFYGNIILNESDTVAIETQASFIKDLQIPGDAPLGHYLLYVRALYNSKVASASTAFDIVTISGKEKVYIIIIIGLVVLIAGFIGFMIIRRIKQKYKQIKRIGLEDLLWR